MTTFAERLIQWHTVHGRHHLPWQNSGDPYRTWLSEIMLQQTQVETVIPYYLRFITQFPDLATLAHAPVEAVMASWSGLGYYARARNLHRAARIIMTEFGGIFPRDSVTINRLPGIGRSTASAIAAFVYGEKCAILDGNVKRVLCRAFGIEGFPGDKNIERNLWALAESLLPDHQIATYTQAQMDLGALLCTRGKPSCLHCPLADICVARQTGQTHLLPTPRPKKNIPRRTVHLALIIHNDTVLLEKRPEKGIWGGLFSLPEIPADQSPPTWIHQTLKLVIQTAPPLAAFSHTFSHFILDIQTHSFTTPSQTVPSGIHNLHWHPLSELKQIGLPAPISRLLETVQSHSICYGTAAEIGGHR